MSADRVCAYGPCTEVFVPRNAEHRFHDRRCRMADWKVRAGYVDPRASKAYRNAGRTGSRARSGIVVSYRRAVNEMAMVLVERGRFDSKSARLLAEQGLRAALSERARRRLDERCRS
jgi:hypothetical protein